MSKKGRSDGDLRPRAEAGPLPCSELTESQKQKARQVLRLLAGMASSTTQFEPYEQDLIRIDPIRHNRTILIDGERGSGKTTLLISLLDALQRHFGQRTDPHHPNDEHEDWAKLLMEATGAALIVPVSLVDLAPLPRRSSLMMLLISCLETIVKRMESASYGVSSEQRAQAGLAPFCHDGERTLQSRVRWNELAAATVQGWDDHAGKRTPPSDLESYAQEQMTAEQQRLDLSNLIDRFLTALQEDFRSYLQKIPKDKQRSRNEAPKRVLFLVAVDDADMNPGRVAELLDALRLLGHRQLAFLLTGDSELFEDTLYKSCLIALAGERLAATDTSSLFRARAEPLAHQIYDKLVPPSHRFVIEQIPREQRLAVHMMELAKTHAQPHEQKARTLGSVLEQSTPRILSILTHCPFLIDVLPGHMRRLQNLLLEIERLSDSHQDATDRESALVHTLWQTIAAEAGRAMTRERFGDVASDSRVLRVSLRSNFADLCLLPALNKKPGPQSPEPLVQLYYPASQLPETDRLGREQALVAALTLAAVTALLQTNGTVKLVESPPRAPREHPLVQVQIALSEPLTLGWPIPAQLALHEQVALVYYFAQWGLADKKDFSELATEYLYLVCTMCKLFTAQGKTLPQVPQTKLSLAEVAKQIHSTAHSQKAGQTIAETSVQTWARHGAALLCAPEYGLPPELANDLLFELRRVFGEKEWPLLRAELAQARRERVLAALPDQGDEDSRKDPSTAPLRAKAEDRILSLIDQQLPDHHFRLLVEEIAAGAIRKALHSASLTVSDATLMLLEQGSAKWLRLLLDGLASLAQREPEDRQLGDRQLGTVLRPAWQATGKTESYGFLADAAPFARLSKESPAEVLQRLRAALMSDRLPRGEILAHGRTDETELQITVSLAALPTFRRAEGQLSPLQEGILHLLWDEQLAGATSLPLTSTQEWPAVSVRIDSTIDQIELPWLSALFRTFAAAGAVTETWNQAVEILHRPEHRRADSTLLDRLAFFYVRCGVAAATAAPMPTSLPEKDLLYRDFGQLLKQVAQTVAQSSETQQEARSGIVTAELWEEVILLAMPESGLSFEGVRSIILFLQNHDADHRHLRSALQRRKDRLSALIWNERDPARRTREECQAAAKRLLEYVEKIARNVGHPFQVWFDTSPKLQAILNRQ